MSIEAAEKLKRELTDKFVVVAGEAPELRRFTGLTGRVKTVNMSCHALVEFDGPVDIGWYDIDPAYLRIVEEPLKKQPDSAVERTKSAAAEAAPAKAAAEKPAVAAPKKTSGKLSPLELARQQDAAKSAGSAPQTPTAETKPPKTSSPKKKLSPLELARQQDAASKQSAASAAKAEPALPAQTPKPSGKKLSPLELARMQDSAAKKPDSADGDAEVTPETPAAAPPETKKAETPGQSGKKLSPLELARMQDSKK